MLRGVWGRTAPGLGGRALASPAGTAGVWVATLARLDRSPPSGTHGLKSGHQSHRTSERMWCTSHTSPRLPRTRTASRELWGTDSNKWGLSWSSICAQRAGVRAELLTTPPRLGAGATWWTADTVAASTTAQRHHCCTSGPNGRRVALTANNHSFNRVGLTSSCKTRPESSKTGNGGIWRNSEPTNQRWSDERVPAEEEDSPRVANPESAPLIP